MTSLAQKKKFSVSTVPGWPKCERKMYETLQETSVEYNNSSASKNEHPFLEWPKDLPTANPSLFKWENFHPPFTLFSTSRNYLVAKFQNKVFEPRSVPTTKHRMERRYFRFGLSKATDYLAVYKEVLETKVLPWTKKITKKLDGVFQQGGALAPTAKTVQGWLDGNMSLWPNDFLPHIHQVCPPQLQLVEPHWRRDLQDTPQQHRWVQGFCGLRLAVDWERLR